MLYDAKRWDPKLDPSPTTIAGHREQFCRDLERGRWRQKRGGFGGKHHACAVGAALRYCGRSPMWWNGLLVPAATRNRLNLTLSLAAHMQWWNDRDKLTFPEIAQRLRQEWRVRP
jgi:hypothetical protein